MKRTKKFNQEWADAIALLPGNLQQSLTDAIRTYQSEGVEPKGLHPIAEALFIVIKPTIDARARRSAYQKERRLRKALSAPTPASASVEEQPQAPVKEQRITPVGITQAPPVQRPPVEDWKPSDGGIPIPRIGVPTSVKRNSNRFLRQVERARNKSNSRH